MIPSHFVALVCDCGYVITARSLESSTESIKDHQAAVCGFINMKRAYSGLSVADWKRNAPHQVMTN